MDESVTCSVVSDSLQSRWTVACQAPLSTGFSRQEYWSGLLFPPPGHRPNSGIKPALQADSSLLEPSREHRELYSAFRGSLNEVTVLSCFEVASSKQPPPSELLWLHVKEPLLNYLDWPARRACQPTRAFHWVQSFQAWHYKPSTSIWLSRVIKGQREAPGVWSLHSLHVAFTLGASKALLVVELLSCVGCFWDCSPPGSSVCGNFPGKSTGVGCHFLLQGIYPTQGLNSHLLPGRWILYHMSQLVRFPCIPFNVPSPKV